MRSFLIAMVVLFGFSSLVQADPPKRGERPDREEMHKKFMEKFDANKDGKIDDKEKAAIREAFAKHHEAAGDKQDREKKDGDKKDGDKKGGDRDKKGGPDGHKIHGSAHGKKGHDQKGHDGHHAKGGHGERDGDKDRHEHHGEKGHDRD